MGSGSKWLFRCPETVPRHLNFLTIHILAYNCQGSKRTQMEKIIVTLTFILCSFTIKAQKPDTIQVGHVFKHLQHLEMDTTRELIYTESNGSTKFSAMKIKTVREVKIKGKSYLEFQHKWMTGNEKSDGNFYFLCEPKTLRPIIHIRNTARAGIEAYQFSDSKVTSLDSIEKNSVKDLNIDLEVPTYVWEIDLETYSLLPMKKGYQVVMNFYHPGGPEPDYYLLSVEKDEKISLPDGSKLDCWVLYTNYGGKQESRFWYSKKDQNFIKMESNYGGFKIFHRFFSRGYI